MTTDGYIDQIGGERRRSFKKKRLKELLLAIVSLSFADQQIRLYKCFGDYQGEESRRDDISVLGFTSEQGVTHASSRHLRISEFP